MNLFLHPQILWALALLPLLSLAVARAASYRTDGCPTFTPQRFALVLAFRLYLWHRAQ